MHQGRGWKGHGTGGPFANPPVSPFSYKKQRRPAQLAVGVAMMIYPYFVSNTLAMIAIAAALVAALLLAVRAGL